ncbi:MAG: hypothetical protein ACK58Z_13205 [Pseudanabaena sp.]
MVERPIKKADRQPQPDGSENTSTRRSDESDKKRSNRDGGKGGKRDKKGGRDEQLKTPVNLALVRGPKPTKTKPVAEEIVAEESAVVEESATEETTEA